MTDGATWDVADEESAWAATFAAGSIADPALQAGTGERVALRVPDAVVATVGVGFRPVVHDVLFRGPVVFTDRRVLGVGEGGPQWPWSDRIWQVFAEASGCGAMVLPSQEALADGDRAWGILPPSMLDPTPPPRHVTLSGLIMWNRAVAAWRASCGQLDQWVLETSHSLRGNR